MDAPTVKTDRVVKKLLFNPEAKEITTMINGDTTNLLNLTSIPKQYAIFHDLVDIAYTNNWLPHKVSMGNDKHDFKHRLTEDEVEAIIAIVSFLVFLDSIQTNNLPNISDYITNPHVVYALARQTWDEAVHSKSYYWILASIMSDDEAAELIYAWRNNPILLARNKFIAKIYQDFVDDPTERNFVRAIIGNFMLEGVYFYNAFQFFHNLANRGLMAGTDTQISYIQRDELVHCTIFENLINITFAENDGMREEYEEMVYDMFREAVQWEIDFSIDTIGDKILGMSSESITAYAHHLGNKRLKAIGYKQIFPKSGNPYKHLEKLGGSGDETDNRANNFEVTSIAYKSPEILDGWDDL